MSLPSMVKFNEFNCNQLDIGGFYRLDWNMDGVTQYAYFKTVRYDNRLKMIIDVEVHYRSDEYSKPYPYSTTFGLDSEYHVLYIYEDQSEFERDIIMETI